MWSAFEALVRKGATFPHLQDVTYPRGENPKGVSLNSDGDSWFYAQALVANQEYQLHKGEDIIIGTNKVTFIDTNEKEHTLEPDILDLYWLSELLDGYREP